jgi:hypothetical protein
MGCGVLGRPVPVRNCAQGEAMTAVDGDAASRSRDMICPSFASRLPSDLAEGAGKAGCRLHPWARCNKKHRGRTTGVTGNNPAFPARWVTVSFVLSPVSALLPPSSVSCVSLSWTFRLHCSVRTTRLRRPRHAHSSVAQSASTASHRAFVTCARPSIGWDGQIYTIELPF